MAKIFWRWVTATGFRPIGDCAGPAHSILLLFHPARRYPGFALARDGLTRSNGLGSKRLALAAGADVEHLHP